MPPDMDGALSRARRHRYTEQGAALPREMAELSLGNRTESLQTAVEIDPRLSAIWTRGLLIKPIFVKK